MESFKDSIYSFFNKNILTSDNKSKIGQYGNDVVDLINKFIRIIIAFMIVYLIIIKLPDHGDADHTMYFNLLLLISILLIIIYIQKNWRDYYIYNFLGAADPSIGDVCAGDLDNIPKEDGAGVPCPQGIEENGMILIDAVAAAVAEEFTDWMNYLYLIGIGLGLRQLGYPMYYAAIIFFPFNCLKGIIYFLLFASKYSPINFLFGKIGSVEDPYIYENKISEGKQDPKETELINFNEKFYVMYIVLILLIFFTIIIRLTSDTIIDCKNFVGPIPTEYLQGCMGYRFYMILNVLLFIGFSTDFMDSLKKISMEDTVFTCPWKVDTNGKPSPMREQIYKSKGGECLNPKNIIDTPICDVNQQILECTPKTPTPLPGCLIKRSNYNKYNYTLKDIEEFNGSDNNIGNLDHRIIISKNPDGNGYIIDPSNGININDSICKNSINNWLASQNNDNLFDPITKDIIDSRTDLTDDAKNLLLKAIGIDNNSDNNSNSGNQDN
tara:strand:- start:216 stop:1700 length:1485 start_codon:yes stop_codon:yes gene_type:complete